MDGSVRLTRLFFVLYMAPILIVGAIAAYMGYNQQLDLTSNELNSIAALVEVRIVSHSEELRTHARLLAVSPEITTAFESYSQHRASFLNLPSQGMLEYSFKTLPDLAAIMFVADGEITRKIERAGIGPVNVTRDHVVDIAGKYRDYVAVDADGNLNIIVQSPVTVNGQDAGSIVMVSRNDSFTDFVNSSYNLGRAGEIYVFGNDSRNQPRALFPGTDGKNAYANLGDSRFSGMRSIIEQAMAGEEGFNDNIVDHRGRVVMTATNFIPSLGWAILVKVDRDDVISSVRYLYGGVIGGLLAISAAFWRALNKIMSNRLLALNMMASSVLDEELTQEERKSLMSEDQDVLSSLSARITKIIERYRLSNQSLEQAVTEKTRELESTQAQLIQSAKMASLGEMATQIAHEINQPLAAIQIQANRIRTKTAKNDLEGLDEVSLKIQKFVERATKIIQHLRRFGRDSSMDELSTMQVNDVINEVLIMFKEQFSESSIELTVELDESLPLIMGNENEVSQMLTNFIGNARDAVADRDTKHVFITTRNHGDRIEVSIEDTGPGLSEQAMEKAFDPFFTTKPVGKGTGIGLSICHSIMEGHGGRIDIQNTGSGARFTAHFPTNAKRLTS